MKKFVLSCILFFVLYSPIFSQSRGVTEAQLKGIERTYTARQVYAILGLPVCSVDPPTGSCTTQDACVDDTNDTLYVCISSLWVSVGGGGGSMTDAEVKIAYENNANTNEFSDAEQTLLGNQSGSNSGDMSNAQVKTAYETNANTNEFSDAEQTLLGNQSGTNTGDMTDAQVKTAYENNANSNEFDDSEQTLLGNQSGINTGDMSNAAVKTAYEANADTNEFDDAEQTLLGNQSGSNSGDEPDATAVVKGIVQLAGDISGTAASPTVVGVQVNAVALTTDTTGDYVDGVTANQGLATTGGEGADLSLIDCAANKVLKRNGGDTAWECADDLTGGGGANSFETWDASSGTDPVASSATDTMIVTGTLPIVVTGDSGADSLTFSVNAATTAAAGASELATLAEVDAGSDAIRTVTPATLATIQTDVDANTTKVTNATHTGDVTGDVALTIAANSVALTADTTGDYVDGITASQGLLMTGTEGAKLGLIVCSADEVLKNSGGSSWACAADEGGGASQLSDLSDVTGTTGTGSTVAFNTSPNFNGIPTFSGGTTSLSLTVADSNIVFGDNSIAEQTLTFSGSGETDDNEEVHFVFDNKDAGGTTDLSIVMDESTIGISANGGFLTLDYSSYTMNLAGTGSDTLIRGLGDNNLFYVDASTDRVGIGDSTPSTKLEVNGTVTATAFAGDITGNLTCTDCVALGTETSGNYASSASEGGDADGVACTDCVALGTETSGAYVSTATASQGLLLSGTEGAGLGLINCTALDVLQRNAGDTGWECAAVGGGSDGDAIHDNQANEIAAITAKLTPVGDDLFIIEDSAASNVKKRLKMSDIEHDLLSGFDTAEHHNHTTISVTAGNGLLGGGSIALTRTLNIGEAINGGIKVNTGTIELEMNDLTLASLDVTADSFAFIDASTSNSDKRAALSTLESNLVHNNLDGGDHGGGGADIKSGILTAVGDNASRNITFATAFLGTPFCTCTLDDANSAVDFCRVNATPSTTLATFSVDKGHGGGNDTWDIFWICTDAGDP